MNTWLSVITDNDEECIKQFHCWAKKDNSQELSMLKLELSTFIFFHIVVLMVMNSTDLQNIL